jgi:hypothetical protein
MNTEQKAEALAALCEFSIKFREPINRVGSKAPWYVVQSVVVCDGRFETGTYGNGNNPADAIDDHWRRLAQELPEDSWLIVRQGDKRRSVRWNGFMWVDCVPVAAVA